MDSIILLCGLMVIATCTSHICIKSLSSEVIEIKLNFTFFLFY